MPEYRDKEVSLAFDICGCPNRCRHCWLGQASRVGMDLSEVLDVFLEARAHVEGGSQRPHLQRVRYFGSSFREPHYCPSYRELHRRELELNEGQDYAHDYELLSIWRLARDHGYAAWAREIGTLKCQISLFGLERTNDWFCRRRGAHRDILKATLRLLDHGIQPRWQLFLTKRGLAEMPGVLGLAKELNLNERCEELGGRFDIFLNDPTPLGEARLLEQTRLTRADVELIPGELVQSTERYFDRTCEWRTEGDWVHRALSAPDEPIGLCFPDVLWFFVTPDWSVYPNIGSLEPWWKLGTLRQQGFGRVCESFLSDRSPALHAAKTLTLHRAAQSYGSPEGEGIYLSDTDLRQLWLERHCERHRAAGET